MTKEHKQYIPYSDAQREQAKNTDIIEFLNHYEGFTFKHKGNGYKCEQHNSLVINADRKRWFWNSIGKGGCDVINYLETIHNKTYLECMDIIIGKGEERPHIPVAPKYTEPEVKELKLPEKTSEKYSRMFAYLINSRHIDKDLILDCMKENLIYQDKNNNVVFVGYDDEKKARFACVRGTLSEKQYRGDCSGSDKSYPFKVEGTEKTRLYVFEAPIDLLSYITISKQNSKQEVWKKHNFISLSGTSDVALENYLERNKNVTSIIFCLDNDEAGNLASETYIKKYSAKGYNALRKAPHEKDFNAELCKSFSEREKEGDKVLVTYNQSLSQQLKK